MFRFKKSSTKNAKCPVTLVVSRCTDKKPATLTDPATKDNKAAIFKLCEWVLVLPWCLNMPVNKTSCKQQPVLTANVALFFV